MLDNFRECRYWQASGEDPKLFPEALKERGVDLKVFNLI